ncbi:MAG: hypothetical protein E7013_03415 [Alphaproteobacteria bacterium]|nr:hypothetical protein [Alphaproteobacteria bacterium]
MAGKLKQALASTVAAVALGAGTVVQAEEVKPLPKEKIEHVQNNSTFLEKGAKYFSSGLKKAVSGLTSVITWPAQKIVNLATDTVRTAGNLVGDVSNAVGDNYVGPTINSAAATASNFIDNTVSDVVDLTHSTINSAVDLGTDTLEGVSSVISGKPEKGLRTIGGSAVQNSAKILGVAIEKTNNAVVNTLDLGTDIAADAIHNTVVRPVVDGTVNLATAGIKTAAEIALNNAPNKEEAKQVKGELKQSLTNLSVAAKGMPEMAHLLAESVQDTVVDGAKLAGRVVRTGLSVAGNVGDAAVRKDLPEFIKTIEPHLEPFGEQIKNDVDETRDQVVSVVDNVVKNAQFAAAASERIATTSTVEKSSPPELNEISENMMLLNAGAQMSAVAIHGVRVSTMLNTLDKLQKADAMVEIANEASKEKVGNSETVQQALSMLSGKDR